MKAGISIGDSGSWRHSRKRRIRGFALLEITAASAILTGVAIMILKSSVQISATQAAMAMQVLTDAYLSRETTLASRVPFDSLTGAESFWPVYPATSRSEVSIGQFPGGNEIRALLIRTREADPGNLASAGGSGTPVSNPARSEAWKLRSVLSFRVAGREYHKGRTVLRVR